LDLDDADPIVEVLAEPSFRDEALEISVRRTDDTHDGGHRLASADPLERSLLEEPKELALHVVREIADLVEEERAPLRELHLAGHAAVRAGEGAALVAEELALDELHGERRPVDDDEGPGLPRGVDVDRPREEP